MARTPRSHWPTGPRTVFFRDVAAPKTLARAVDDGRIRKLTTGVWTADLDSGPEEIVAARIWDIVGDRLPGSVIVDRTAAVGGRVVDGMVTVATDDRTTNLSLPGVSVVVRPLGRDETDLPWTNGLTVSAPARTIVDNLALSRSRSALPPRTLSVAEVQDWLAEKVMSWPPERLERLRVDAEAYAVRAGVDDRIPALCQLFEEASGARPLRAQSGTFARAVQAGDAWDQDRLRAFDRARATLGRAEAIEHADLAFAAPANDGELPFFEAYFSNYIEGTEFTIDDAREIVETQTPPATRPADGHDILGTHRLVVDPVGRARTSDDIDELVDLLQLRHRTLLAGRPEARPGEFKTEANQVGGVTFVEPELVAGTLRRGLEGLASLPPGFARAVYLMFVVAEVHPFVDGNGRAARLMMNAELSAVGQCRIVVPTVLRNEYVIGLRKATREGGDVGVVAKVLAHGWRWTAAMPWTDRAAADGQLVATNATVDSNDAEGDRIHLEIP